ncbi:hypothetical protein C8Z91_21900 [Paenibacillus elgii]|uniref:Uncharacterized protein n=1 Tax=Paenibacillus elgii TaxID=189691 RepID=A0A2T6FYV4_9BACL|nr:Imm3 family immunity protein [Paenibacillus elgii]PUA37104.1 hypothetical protein C8Z91_21900 [Paenibacillus elgii]
MNSKLSYEKIMNLFDETFQEYKNKKMSNLESLAKTYEDFELIMSKGDLEKATVLIKYGEHVLNQPYVFYKSKEYLVKFLNEINYEILQKELTDEHYQDLINRKNEVLQNLNKKALSYNARAMWYYDEIIDEVNHYYNSISLEGKTSDDIAKDVLARFNRDCRNTKSEKIGVYTTLAERLLDDSLTDTNELRHIESALKEFNVDDVGQQLTSDEKQKLQIRIEMVLKRLSDI